MDFFCSPTYPSIAQVPVQSLISGLFGPSMHQRFFFFPSSLPLSGMSQHGMTDFCFYFLYF